MTRTMRVGLLMVGAAVSGIGSAVLRDLAVLPTVRDVLAAAAMMLGPLAFVCLLRALDE